MEGVVLRDITDCVNITTATTTHPPPPLRFPVGRSPQSSSLLGERCQEGCLVWVQQKWHRYGRPLSPALATLAPWFSSPSPPSTRRGSTTPSVLAKVGKFFTPLYTLFQWKSTLGLEGWRCDIDRWNFRRQRVLVKTGRWFHVFLHEINRCSYII